MALDASFWKPGVCVFQSPGTVVDTNTLPPTEPESLAELSLLLFLKIKTSCNILPCSIISYREELTGLITCQHLYMFCVFCSYGRNTCGVLVLQDHEVSGERPSLQIHSSWLLNRHQMTTQFGCFWPRLLLATFFALFSISRAIWPLLQDTCRCINKPV